MSDFGDDLGQLVARVHNVTGAPALTSAQYHRIFESLSEHLDQAPYRLTDTSKAVRDRCVELGEPISRAEINFVLRGIAYRRGFVAAAPTDPDSLAAAFAENVLGLVGAAQLELTEDERRCLAAWITGPAPAAEVSGSSEAADEPPALAEAAGDDQPEATAVP
jgi:hypothetical protein